MLCFKKSSKLRVPEDKSEVYHSMAGGEENVKLTSKKRRKKTID